MKFKMPISLVLLLALLSCSPDQEVLLNDQYSTDKNVPYRILDMDEFSKKDRKKIENAINMINKESYEKTEVNRSLNLKDQQTMTNIFSVYGIVFDQQTSIVLSGANITRWKNGKIKNGTQSDRWGDYVLAGVEHDDTLVYSMLGYLPQSLVVINPNSSNNISIDIGLTPSEQ